MKSQKLAFQVGITLLCTFFQPASAQDFQGQETPSNANTIDEAARSLGLSIGNGLNPTKRPPGYYVVFDKADAGWKVGSISNEASGVLDFANREVLFFSKDLNYVDPDFRDFRINTKTGQFECMTGVLRTNKANRTSDYNPCQSSLTTTVDAKIGSQAALAVASLGLSLLTGTTMREVAVDKMAVLAVLQKTDVLDRLKETKAADDRRVYQEAFKKAKSASSLNAFIERYLNNDPDGLVPQAIERRDIAKGNDYRKGFESATTSAALDFLIKRYEGNDPDNLIPKAIERRNLARVEEQKTAEAQRQWLAAEAERNRRLEVEQNRQKLAAVKTIGTKICNSYTGVRNKYMGIVGPTGPVTMPVAGVITVTGFTEGVSGNRLQIRASSIRHKSQSGEFTNGEFFNNEATGVKIVPNGVFWDDIANWTPC